MSYAYNAHPVDIVYDIPPAAGTVWLQSPITASPGSVARFGEDYRQDYANVPLSAYAFYISASSIYKDPVLGHAQGAQMMLQNMQARLADGARYTDPVTGSPVDIPLTGDPVLARDWIDGIINSPGDRRHLSSCGPVTLAVGDTQKVVIARFVADVGNHLLSVRKLRNAARQLHDIYTHLPFGSPAPVFSSAIDFPAQDSYAVHVTGGPFPSMPSMVEAVLREEDGTEIQRITLADDGMHGDGAAGDGVYGGMLIGSTRPRGADLFVLTSVAGETREWFVDSELPLPGRLRLRLTDVLAEDRHPDAAVNPGEHVRLGLRLENDGVFDSAPWHVFLRGPFSLGAEWKSMRLTESVAAGSTVEVQYDADDISTHLPLKTPEDFPPGAILRLPVSILTGDYCHWSDTLAIAVQPYPDIPVDILLEHVEGLASGTLGATVVDGSALTEYDYRVSVEGDDTGPKTLHIENVTLGTTLRRDVPMPTPWTPHSEVIDGWRLNLGTAFDALVYDDRGHKLTSFYDEYRVAGTFSEPSRSWFTVHPSDQAYTLVPGEDMTRSRLSQYDLVPVRLVFDRMNGQKAPSYLRGQMPNYAYQGYFDIPVRAYDIRDEDNPRQVMLGFTEQSGRPSHDSVWIPTTELADREMLLVFSDDYSEQPQEKFMQALATAAEDMDILYALQPVRDEDMPMFEDGDEYTIVAPVPVSNRDVYILAKPRLLDVRSIPTRPSTTELHPNYPNPFGTGSAAATKQTTVRFSTVKESHVRLAVYDLLGRRVALLVDQALPAGTHQTQLHAGNLTSGSYIIVLDAAGERKSRNIAVLK
ncbi:MAG: T9SS type A sorting domain-containing protein [Bacteroidetes bacterium]|nr:T9SS type A sorting domain-containing protein [Bacteroidota bacterium]